MTEDLQTLQIFAVIGFVAVGAVIVVLAIWLLAQVGRWLGR